MKLLCLLLLLFAQAHGMAFQQRDVETPSPGLLLDRYSQSGLEFHQWVERMIDEGHLYPSNVTSDGLIFLRDENESWTVKLKNVACNRIHGSRDTLMKAQSHFCGWVQKIEQIKAKEMEEDVTNVLCDDGVICRLGVRTAFDFLKVFPDNVQDITNACNEMFDQLHLACPDGGGVADTEVTDKQGNTKESGKVEASFSHNNVGECNPSQTRQCHEHEL
ncbi:hypothetical protein BKA67DRAFT_664462 [Truncatella angustata]|uniref:Uncharacterized protein n=1 Tax=Truncatella angustata TaxID=152316 RepID=A0A9P8RG49_9PEZI|nr:uncharacterized protein BKA67DRAFT_664462 [Truncatella angustata]KAH6645378.1 hypothetical protein BKA67DRAFT_664462 [Truncatella angustata]KAH8193617.1 hypothetical protein TruAng_012214 [Truncatella angustata]